MKIVFVAPRFHTNQTGIVTALRARGHDVAFHVTAVGATEDHTVLKPMLFKSGLLSDLLQKVLPGRDSLKTRIFPPIFRYYRYLRSQRPDIVIVRNPSRFFSLLAASCGRLIGARVIFYTQTPLYHRYGFLKRAGRQILLAAFGAAWMTPIMGDRRAGEQLRRSYFVPFAVPADAARIPLFRPNSTTNLLMVAKYQKRKNHELLIRALSHLNREHSFKLTLIGQCVTDAEFNLKQQIADLCTTLGLRDKVTFVDNVPPKEMSNYYNRSDLFVLPSSLESASISILEAIAHGTPAVCSDTCGTRSYIEEGLTGATFRDGDLPSLTETLKCLLADRTNLAMMRKRCQESARRQFSSEAYYCSLSRLLNDRWPSPRIRTESSEDPSRGTEAQSAEVKVS